jgi:hypothetical protein
MQMMLKGKDTVKYITAQRIKCWEHLKRTEGIRIIDWTLEE